jgi:hypothetical protein
MEITTIVLIILVCVLTAVVCVFAWMLYRNVASNGASITNTTTYNSHPNKSTESESIDVGGFVSLELLNQNLFNDHVYINDNDIVYKATFKRGRNSLIKLLNKVKQPLGKLITSHQSDYPTFTMGISDNKLVIRFHNTTNDFQGDPSRKKINNTIVSINALISQ